MTNPGGPYWQEQSPQYPVDPTSGQPQNYQGFGAYQPPTGPPSNRTPLIITLVALVLVIGGVTTTLLLAGGDSNPPAIAAPDSSAPVVPSRTSSAKPTVPKKTTSAKPSTGATPTDVEQIKIDPVIPGWQGVLSYKENIAYDVPKDWKVESPGMLTGFEDNAGKPTAIMHGVSTYKPDACPASKGSYRGKIGLVTAGDIEPAQGARGGAKLFADAAALNEDGTVAPVVYTEPVATKVNQGKIDAMTATATVTPPQTGGCPAPTMVFTTVAFRNGTSTALFMMYMDQGTPDALPADVAQQLITSLRPHTG